ncbi:MAG TPA: MerR family transcriptional regulator [Sedimentisphaerales bacterium]|nr:MerR family transcriptional regulator [Sedimentisphaerales bacterium]
MQAQVKSQRFQIPVRLYRIGDLVRYTPFSRQTIHNYTTMGLIREAQWTEGGHRLYDESVFERLSRILELKKTRTLWEIRQILTKEDAATGLSAQDNCSATQTNSPSSFSEQN